MASWPWRCPSWSIDAAAACFAPSLCLYICAHDISQHSSFSSLFSLFSYILQPHPIPQNLPPPPSTSTKFDSPVPLASGFG
jgi:hypothetical protein